MALFAIEHLSYYYPNQARPALEDISLTLAEGEFILLTGPSGGGKTTLARALSGLIPDFYGGTVQGNIHFKGQSLFSMDRSQIHKSIGMVFQDPEKQILMGRVESDLVLGLENLGLASAVMTRLLTETINVLGLNALRRRPTAELSSGEKQKVAIGSILAMMPRVLILDEPISQLDPVAAQEIFAVLEHLNRDHGLTIILIEQRLEHCLPLAHRVIFIDGGKIMLNADPKNFVQQAQHRYEEFIPPVPRLFCGNGREIPLTVAQAIPLLREKAIMKKENDFPSPEVGVSSSPSLKIEKVSFAYDKYSSEMILENVNLAIGRAQCVALLGENGAGKSTLLKIIAGLLQPWKGRVMVENADVRDLGTKERSAKIGFLSQNPNDYLFHDTVEEELLFTMKNLGIAQDGILEEILERLELRDHRQSYPRDLSTGERQRVALGSVLVSSPQWILLDEPTRGLDSRLKQRLRKILKDLSREKNISILLVTQDVEFAAEFADRIILLSEGRILIDDRKEKVLSGNLFYSTAVNRLFRGIQEDVVTFEQARKFFEARGGFDIPLRGTENE